VNGPRGLSTGATGATGASGLGPTATFSSVDLDVWATDFLAAVDLYLSPPYAVPLAQLTGPSGGVGITAINRLIAAKETLADAIAGTVSEVLIAGPTGGAALRDAQDALRQQLLVNLSSGFATDAIIWSPFSVTGPTGFVTPPSLSGTPVDAGESPTGPTGGAFSLSTAKVPLQARSAASFLFNVQTATEHKNVPLDLDYVVSEVEHDIHDVPGITGYQASSWLTLILPDGPNGGSQAGPVGATSVHLDTHIGRVDVPIALRAYPTPPTMLTQSASPSYSCLGETASTRLDRAKRWDYTFTYRSESAEQDTQYLSLAFNERVDRTASLVDSAPRDLFDWLAQFVTVYPDLQRDLASVPVDGGGVAAARAISVFADLATEIAGTWRTYPPVGPARVLPPGMTAEIYTYRMRMARDQASQKLTTLTIEQLAAADIDIGWPDVYYVGPSERIALPVSASGPTSRTFAYPTGPSGITASAPLTQELRYSKLDAIALSDAWAGVAVARNEALLGPSGPPTNPSFVYRTPLVRFIDSQTPNLTWNESISIPETVGITGPATLPEFVTPLLANLFEWDRGKTRSWTMSVAAQYGYELVQAPDDDGLTSFVPILLRPSFVLDPSQAVPYGPFVTGLSSGLTGWASDNRPSLQKGTFALDVSVYAPGISGPRGATGSEATGDKPMLALRDLVIPIDLVRGITGITGGIE
jgi:hypothetical protein